MGGVGAVTLQSVVSSGATSNQNIVLDGANLVFEGYLTNAYETTLTLQNQQQIERLLYQTQLVLWH